MASIHIGNTLIEDDKIWAGSKINPYCFVGDAQFYPEEEFEKWKISKVTINYYNSSGDQLSGDNRILRANGSSYCTVQLEIQKGKQKRKTGDWRAVWPSVTKTVYPDDIYSFGNEEDTIGTRVVWDSSSHRLTWNNSGSYAYTPFSGGDIQIVCYYSDPEKKINEGDKLISTHELDLKTEVSEPTVNLQENIKALKYTLEDFGLGSVGTESNKVPAKGSTVNLNGAIWAEEQWTTGSKVGCTAKHKTSDTSAYDVVSGRGVYKNTYIPDKNLWEYTMQDELELQYAFFIDGGTEKSLHCTIPSLGTHEISDGYYILQLKVGGNTTNELRIYQESNVVTNTEYNSNLYYRYTGVSKTKFTTTTPVEVPNNISNVYISAIVTQDLVYTSTATKSDVAVSASNLYISKIYEGTTTNITSMFSDEWIVPLETVYTDSYFTIKLKKYYLSNNTVDSLDISLVSGNIKKLAPESEILLNGGDNLNISAGQTSFTLSYISTVGGSYKSIEVTNTPTWVTTSTIDSTNKKITFRCNENFNNQRSGSITITQADTGKTSTVTITQYKCTWTLSTSDTSINYNDTEFTVSAYSVVNGNYVEPEIELDSSTITGLSGPTISSSGGTYHFTYNCSINTSRDSNKTANFTFTQPYTDEEESCTVTQQKDSTVRTITIENGGQVNATHGSQSGYLEVTLINVDWGNVTIESYNNYDWCSLVKKPSGELYWSIEENNSSSSRNAYFIITDSSHSWVQAEVTITQEHAPVYSLSFPDATSNKITGIEAGDYTIRINTTRDGIFYDDVTVTRITTNCTVSDNSDWNSSGNVLLVPVTLQPSGTSYDCKFRVTQSGGESKDLTITVTPTYEFTDYNHQDGDYYKDNPISSTRDSFSIMVVSKKDGEWLLPSSEYLEYWCPTESNDMNIKLSTTDPFTYDPGSSFIIFNFTCNKNTDYSNTKEATLTLWQQDPSGNYDSGNHYYWTGKKLVYNIKQEKGTKPPTASFEGAMIKSGNEYYPGVINTGEVTIKITGFAITDTANGYRTWILEIPTGYYTLDPGGSITFVGSSYTYTVNGESGKHFNESITSDPGSRFGISVTASAL